MVAIARETIGPAASGVGTMLKLIRVHQWIKNAFVAAPLFFSPAAFDTPNALLVLAGVLCFCAVSSAIYILNDYVDREADRQHPKKRRRPLAAGTVTVPHALTVMVLLGVGGLGGAVFLSVEFFEILGAYAVLNVLYCFWLKNLSIVDLIVISAGFVLRIEAGAELIHAPSSVWIVLCTGFLAMFLAIAKRRDDVVTALGETHRKSLRGYNRSFLDSALVIVLGGVLVSYTIYTTDRTVMESLGSERLYLTVPFVLAGVLRYLQITQVEERSGSPTRIVVTDAFLILTILGWIATFALLIHA